jgi:hypothetical protein
MSLIKDKNYQDLRIYLNQSDLDDIVNIIYTSNFSE